MTSTLTHVDGDDLNPHIHVDGDNLIPHTHTHINGGELNSLNNDVVGARSASEEEIQEDLEKGFGD